MYHVVTLADINLRASCLAWQLHLGKEEVGGNDKSRRLNIIVNLLREKSLLHNHWILIFKRSYKKFNDTTFHCILNVIINSLQWPYCNWNSSLKKQMRPDIQVSDRDRQKGILHKKPSKLSWKIKSKVGLFVFQCNYPMLDQRINSCFCFAFCFFKLR